LVRHQGVNRFSAQGAENGCEFALPASNSHRGTNPPQSLQIDSDHPVSERPFDFPAVLVIDLESFASFRSEVAKRIDGLAFLG
jgi:hypothetical protein